MRRRLWIAGLCLLFVFAACGRGKASKPPVIRIEPHTVTDSRMEEMNFAVGFDRVSVEGDGYKELARALDEISDEIESDVTIRAEGYTQDLSEMWEELDEESRETRSFSFSYEAEIVRADTEVVSIRYLEDVYLGGAHPATYTDAYNLDARTGERLELYDIVEDSEAYSELCDTLVEELGQYSDDFYSDYDYEETINSLFFGDGPGPVWFYKEDSIEFVFDQYLLAPYASGKFTAEIPLERIRLAEADADDGADEEPTEVHVSTADEFMKAIRSNAKIYLAPGVYDLTDWMRSAELPDDSHVKLLWEAIEIRSVSNLEILAESKLPTQIVIQEEYSDVLRFARCRDLTLEGLILGHAVEPGYCSGDVLEFEDCRNIKLRDMDLYGCGAYGISAYRCDGLEMTESWIHDCTYGIMFLSGCQDFHFKDSMFTYCKEYTLLDGSGSELSFENCIFDKNEGEFLPDPGFFDVATKFTFKNCRFLSGEDEWFERSRDYVTVVND